MKCCFCGKDAGEYGNNAEPLKKGKCCDYCNETRVIPARLKIIQEARTKMLQEDIKK